MFYFVGVDSNVKVVAIQSRSLEHTFEKVSLDSLNRWNKDDQNVGHFVSKNRPIRPLALGRKLLIKHERYKLVTCQL